MSLIAGIVGALLVLLLMPVLFGVNPYDLVRGRLSKVIIQQEKSETKANATRTVISPSQGGLSVAAIAQKVTPSIVNIDVRAVTSTSPFMSPQATEGTGSGVIYTSDGYIITNNHVVSGAQSITVTLSTGESIKGTVVGTSPENDIAVVKIDKTGLTPASLGTSDSLVVGELAVAIGSPFGFEETVTSGIVSGLDRTVTETTQSGGTGAKLTGLIQTDAPINPGNSGGALCDGNARVIGINTIIASASGGSEGIGFSIPINQAKAVAQQIIGGRTVGLR